MDHWPLDSSDALSQEDTERLLQLFGQFSKRVPTFRYLAAQADRDDATSLGLIRLYNLIKKSPKLARAMLFEDALRAQHFYSIYRFAVLDQLRQRRPIEEAETPYDDRAYEGPRTIYHFDFPGGVNEALMQLSAPDYLFAARMLMHIELGVSPPKAAEELGISTSTYFRRKVEMLRKLRAILEQKERDNV